MSLTIAERSLPFDDAFQLLRAYGDKHSQTVAYYDHGGQDSPNAVTLADIGRLVVINARLSGNDVGRLIQAVDADTWSALPLDASFLDLPEDPSSSDIYQKASDIYALLTPPRRGVQMTKATKLMHLKRPQLMPIVDSVAQTAYGDLAAKAAKEIGRGRRAYWPCIWADARRNEDALPPLRRRLADCGSPVADLPSLRLHDMLVWSLFSEPTA